MNRPEPDSGVAHLRVPPHSLEAEQSVLGALLLSNEAWDHVGDLLTDADFYRFEHRLIYGAIGALVMACKPADTITVFEHLQALGKVEEVGGLAYLNNLSASVPNAANVRRYAEVVRERAVLRKLIATCDEVATRAFNTGGQTAAQILGHAQEKLFALGDAGAGQSEPQLLSDLVPQALREVEEKADAGGVEITGIATGFSAVDEMLCGLQRGDLVIVAARPSMGKSAYAMNIAEHVAIVLGLPVAVFSMEMGGSQLALRSLASVGKINGHALRKGRLGQSDWSNMTAAAHRIAATKVLIDESPALSHMDICTRSRRAARCLGKLGLIVIDYLQLMRMSSGDENRATAIGDITRALKGLAKELQCPVIALSQLNRSVETRPDKRPIMSDIRESGAVEQDADVIKFIYRDDYYNEDSPEPGVAEIIIGKNRCGPTGTAKLAFLKPMTKFENLDPNYTPPPRESQGAGRKKL